MPCTNTLTLLNIGVTIFPWFMTGGTVRDGKGGAGVLIGSVGIAGTGLRAGGLGGSVIDAMVNYYYK